MGDPKILTREEVEAGADISDRWTWELTGEDRMRLAWAERVNLSIADHVAPLREHGGDLRATCLHYMDRVAELERELAEARNLSDAYKARCAELYGQREAIVARVTRALGGDDV